MGDWRRPLSQTVAEEATADSKSGNIKSFIESGFILNIAVLSICSQL
jgi:hypothetical protein